MFQFPTLFSPLIDDQFPWRNFEPILMKEYEVATVVTRSIGGTNDLLDKRAIKVDAETYKDKWGVIEVTLTSYAWGSGSTAGDYGEVDLRVPQFNLDNDDPVVDHVTLVTSGGTTAITKKYCFAVNNGEPPPSAFAQGDGTWDLLHLTFKLPEDNELDPLAVTLTYSIAFTDLTPSSNPSDTGTLTLAIDNLKTLDNAFVTNAASTFIAKNGRVLIQINDLHLTIIDQPINDPVVSAPVAGDSVALFTVVNDRSTIGFGKQIPIVTHPTSKLSGDKNYAKKLMVFAINQGKVDGNGRNIKATVNNVSFIEVRANKLAEWPCDDHISAILDYALTWTEMV